MKKINIKSRLSALLIGSTILCSGIVFTACSELAQVASQLQGVANLVNCEYSMNNIDNVTLAGINLKKVAGGNIDLGDVAKLTTALITKQIPLAMDMNMNVKNPTSTQAHLTTLDWALDIDQSQFATGTMNKSYNIPASKTTVVPLPISTDLYSLFANDGIESVKNFAKSFSKDGTSSKVGVRVRPSINVGGTNIKSPSFISLTKNTGANTSTSISTKSATTTTTSPATPSTNSNRRHR